MEDKKKSFLFNVEWQEILLDYPAEVRLEVYDAIIRYVATGTLSELKPMANMAFSFIKKEIDYNTDKYNETIEKNRANGKKGGAPKGNKNASKNNRNNQTVEKTTETTLYDNDNDNVNEREKEKERNNPPEPPASDYSLLSLDECRERMKGNTQWIEVFCMNNAITDINTLYSWIDKFFAQLQNEGVETKQLRDATSHFSRWYNLNKGKDAGNNQQDELKERILNKLKNKQ